MATVKGGFFAQYSGTYVTDQSGKSANRRTAAKFLDKVNVPQELALTLNGVAPGAAALYDRKRIQASETLGGRRVIETYVEINRNSAAADKTALDQDIFTYGGITMNPVPNRDRNPLGTR